VNARLYVTHLSLFHKTKMGGYHSQLLFSSPVLRSHVANAYVAKHLHLPACRFDTSHFLLGNRPVDKIRAKPLPSLLSERESLAAESWSFARFLAVAVLLLPQNGHQSLGSALFLHFLVSDDSLLLLLHHGLSLFTTHFAVIGWQSGGMFSIATDSAADIAYARGCGGRIKR
jgi:hypothetical protein